MSSVSPYWLSWCQAYMDNAKNGARGVCFLLSSSGCLGGRPWMPSFSVDGLFCVIYTFTVDLVRNWKGWTVSNFEPSSGETEDKTPRHDLPR